MGLLFTDIARFRGIIFDQMMSSNGLTHKQAILLNSLFFQDGQTQTDLANILDVGTVTISGLVDRLEAKGWVERREDKKDRRAKRVWLTPKVAKLQPKMVEAFKELNSITVDGMSESEVDQLVTLLRSARTKLGERLEKKV